MKKVSEVSSTPLSFSGIAIPGVNEWSICYKADGSFAQQLVVQLASIEAVKSLIVHTNGSGIRVGGRNLTVEIRSIHPDACTAGFSAENFIDNNAAGGDPGGQCL